MNNLSKRIVCGLVVAAVLCSIVACNQIEENPNSTTTSTENTSVPQTTITDTPFTTDINTTPPQSDTDIPESETTENTETENTESESTKTESLPEDTDKTPADTTLESPVDTESSPIPTNPPDTNVPSTTEATTTTPPPTTPKPTTTPSPQPANPSAPYIITPVAKGTDVLSNDRAMVDVSNSSEGYIMVRLSNAMEGTYKIVLQTPVGAKYTFQLNSRGDYEVIPITEGNGTYTVYVLKQTSANKGTVSFKTDFSVTLSDSIRVFLTPNQYCMYNSYSDCVALASNICTDNMDTLQKVDAVYNYVINNIDYKSTPENAANGYVPNPDTVLYNKYGICFDYASLMTAMLRSQKIPTKVVVGYAGDIYHAWISVYVEGSGWIDGIIYFNGNSWNRMDPTFASGSVDDENEYQSMIEYIKNDSNYTELYYY